MNIVFVPFSKRAFSDILEGVNSTTFSLAAFMCLGLSSFYETDAISLYLTQCIILHMFRVNKLLPKANLFGYFHFWSIIYIQ